MIRATIKMGGLSRSLTITQDGPDASKYQMAMPGYYPHVFAADNLGDAVNIALVSIGKLRRDEQAKARSSARGKALQLRLRQQREAVQPKTENTQQPKTAAKPQ